MDKQPAIQPQPITDETSGGITPAGPKKSIVKRVVGAVLIVIVAILVTLWVLYLQALRPVDRNDTSPQTVEIISGMTPAEIGSHLKENDLIRNEFAFSLYTRLEGVRNQLQAGSYQLQKDQSVQQITAALVEGPSTQEIEVTFLPGATLLDSKKVLTELGFDDAEVDAAFAARYDHPLFEGRPATADIEGYLYGETHRFAHDASLETILTRFFDDMYAVVEAHDLVAAYRQQGLSLYEGITLASIIQKEVSGQGDSRQVAQVFYKRLTDGMPLGADATFVYAAAKAGDTPRVDHPSPYNTRIHGGLPPGPISAPGEEALLATANPAEGDFLYFVSGDDGTNYFSRTEEEHIENTRRYCIENCALF